MFTFECKDMEMDCDYVATAASKEEVMDMAMAHAVEAHADVLQGLSTEQTEEMNAKLTAVIKEQQDEEMVAEDASPELEGEAKEVEEDLVTEDADGDDADDDEEEVEGVEGEEDAEEITAKETSEVA